LPLTRESNKNPHQVHNVTCSYLQSYMKSNDILANPRNRKAIGFILSVLFHVLLVLFIVKHPAEKPKKEMGTSRTAPLTVTLLPPSTDAQQAASSAITVPRPPKPTPKQAGHPKETARKDENVARRKPTPVRKPSTAIARAPSNAPAPPPAQPATNSADAPTDMMSMLNAARERRRAAGVPDRNDAPSEAKPAQDDNAIARANVEHSLRSPETRGDNDAGGLFQVNWSGVRTAEVIFFGWNENRRRTARQFFEIDAGLNGDIDTAIVRKMIEVIRQEKSGDFEWESRRLGRVVMLSARPKDDAELMAFLKQDFIQYARARRN
jgi:hypothetical protein